MTEDVGDRQIGLSERVRRLLLVSMYYAPENSGNAPYVTGLAEHLVTKGWDVIALVGTPHYPMWRSFGHTGKALRAKEMLNGVEVRRHRHRVPRRQNALSRSLYEGSFYLNVRTSRIPAADAVLGVSPSLSGAALARPIAERAGCNYGLLFQDIMGRAASEAGVPGGRSVASLVHRLECRAIGNASVVGVVTEGFIDYVTACGAGTGRVMKVPNWSHLPGARRERAAVRNEMRWAGSTVVLHAGNIGFKQGLERLRDSIVRARDLPSPLKFVFMGEGNRKQHLVGVMQGLPNVEFIPPQDPQTYADILSAADVLLVHEAPGVSEMSLPSKLTSYFAAGRPVIACVEPGGTTAREIQRSGAGLLVGRADPDALLNTISSVVADPVLAGRLAASGRRYSAACLERAHSLNAGTLLVERIAASARARKEGEPA